MSGTLWSYKSWLPTLERKIPSLEKKGKWGACLLFYGAKSRFLESGPIKLFANAFDIDSKKAVSFPLRIEKRDLIDPFTEWKLFQTF